MGHLSMGEHFPHQHAKGPDIRLSGEIALQDGLGGHPAQRHPGLAKVVVLAAGGKHTQAWGGAPMAHRVQWGTRPGIPNVTPGLALIPRLEPNFSQLRHSEKLLALTLSMGVSWMKIWRYPCGV